MNQPIIPSTNANSIEVFLGRQPILDTKQHTIAYELLFRSRKSLTNPDFDDLAATSTVILNTLSEFGLEHVLGKNDGFLNISASLLMSETIELLPPDRIVLEILEDVPVNTQILSRCRALKDIGFRLAIDGFDNRAERASLLPYMDYVKIDLSVIPIEKVAEFIAAVRKVSSAKVIAEKVEHEEQFLQCKEFGFDAFQGYFFAKPTLLKGKTPQPHHITLMRIMGMLLADADLSELESLFKNNPSLTISLLRLVNSVGVSGGRQKIESIRQAIAMLGQKQLMRWVQLLLYTSPQNQGDNTLMLKVTNRAKLMELIAKKVDTYQTNFCDQAFMVGMLSHADVIMQTQLATVLNEIGLSDELKDSILSHQGIFGELLYLVEAIELGDFDFAEKEISKLQIKPEDLLAIQLESMQWSGELSKQAA